MYDFPSAFSNTTFNNTDSSILVGGLDYKCKKYPPKT